MSRDNHIVAPVDSDYPTSRPGEHDNHGQPPSGAAFTVAPGEVGALARRGTMWLALEQGVTWFLNFSSRIFLARLLTPQDFGLVAIVLLVQGLVQMLGTRGVGASVIQRQDHVEEFANAAFWLNPLLGATMGAAQILLAPIVADFYHEPLLRDLLRVSAIGFFVSPWGATHATLLQKRLQLQRRTARQIILRTIITAGIVLMAYRGFGVWSFVIPPLFGDPIEVYLNWRFARWRPKMRLYLHRWKEIFGFGMDIFGAQLVRYLIQNLDYLIIGRLLGTRQLGLYNFAFRQSMFATQNVTLAASRVAFPTFALLQSDREQFTRMFAKSVLLLASITLPVQMGQFIVAPEYIEVIYSRKWLPAVFPFRVLLLYGSAVAISGVANGVLVAMGRVDIFLKWNLAVVPLLVAGIALGARWGINGVAVSVGIILGGSSWLFLHSVTKRLGYPSAFVYRTLWPPVASSLLMAGAVFAVRAALYAMHVDKPIVLAVCVGVGIIAYGLAMAQLFRFAWRQVADFVLRAIGELLGGAGAARRGRVPLKSPS